MKRKTLSFCKVYEEPFRFSCLVANSPSVRGFRFELVVFEMRNDFMLTLVEKTAVTYVFLFSSTDSS